MQELSSSPAPIAQPPVVGAPSKNDRGNRLDVLLIEDNASDARLLQAFLADCDDLRLSWAPTLGAALEHPSLRQFAAIILDLSLPDARGGDLIARVQAAAPDAPIIVSSGQAADDQLLTQAVIRKGAEDFLPKSEMTPALAVRTVTMAIERSRRRTAERPWPSAIASPWGQPHVARFVWSAADRQVRLIGDVGRLIGVDPAIAGAADKVLIRRLPARMRHSLSVARRELRAGADHLSVVLVEPPTACRAHDLAIDIAAERDWRGRIARLEGLCREVAMPSEVERLADGTASALGHKLRTPLTAIRGALGLLAGSALAPLPAEAKPLVDQAMANANRLALLVAALIDPDGSSVGEAPLMSERLPFGVALDAAIAARQQPTPAAKLDLALTRTCRSIDRPVDTDRLRRAVDCLLGRISNGPEADSSFVIEAMEGIGIVWLKLCCASKASASASFPLPVARKANDDPTNISATGVEALRVAVVLAD